MVIMVLTSMVMVNQNHMALTLLQLVLTSSKVHIWIQTESTTLSTILQQVKTVTKVSMVLTLAMVLLTTNVSVCAVSFTTTMTKLTTVTQTKLLNIITTLEVFGRMVKRCTSVVMLSQVLQV